MILTFLKIQGPCALIRNHLDFCAPYTTFYKLKGGGGGSDTAH